jgi:ribosomal protein L23
MTSREVKKQFETKFNVKVDWFNDINKKNNTQRLKIRFVSDTTKPGVNLINSRRDEFFDYFKNELNLTVEKYQWCWMYENLDTIVIRLAR